MGGCIHSKTSNSNHNNAFDRPKRSELYKSSTIPKLKLICPGCGRNDRITDVARYSHVGFYDSAFMSDYYYDFGLNLSYVGRRTRFCFFRPTGLSVTYICDNKH